MNLYTLFYTRSFMSGSHQHTLPGFCRVWANSEKDALETCNEKLVDVFAIVAGHPEILSHSGEQIPTYDWGNPN